MSKLYCNQSSKFLPIFAELEDLPSTCIANCVFNIFLTYTAFMLNIVTIYAIYKTSTMPKTLKTLLLSLACSDVAVGLFSQPLYTSSSLSIRIYQTVRRHKNLIQSMQIRDEAQSEEIKKLTALIKYTVGIFYVYLVFLICYLPLSICMAVIQFYGSSIVLKKLFLFLLTLVFLNSSLNPVIYCWKMRHIRHAIIDILRKMYWNSNRPFRINYNRSSSVVHIDNWSPLCGLQRLWQ